ncbi:MAG: uracil-xanthine permease family protein [Spirochaetales bacterium]
MKKINYSGKDFVLSLQHMFAMLGATILVPILSNMNISIALIAAGLGTMAFYFIAQKKVPVFLGSSFAFLPSYIAILGTAGLIGSPTWNTAMGGLAVALVLTGLVYLLFAFIVKKIGVEKIKQIFPTIVIGPVVILIGLILAPKMLYNNIVANYVSGGSSAFNEWSCAIITALVIIIINAFTKQKSFLRVMPIIIGFTVGYLYGAAIGLVNLDGVFSGQIFVFQNLNTYLGFYGSLNINWSIILSIMPIAIVSIMEHLGDISANSIICGKDFIKDPGLHRTLTGDGVATMIAGALGGPANTTYGENTAVLALTKNYNPRNIFIAACLTVLFGIFTPFAEFLTSIPPAVIGGASIVLFGMIASSGLRGLIEARVDLSNSKNLIISTLILSVGLGLGALSLIGDVTGNTAYKIMVGGIEMSPLFVATVLGIFLNLVLPNEKPKETNA